jgi:hypothetical protein
MNRESCFCGNAILNKGRTGPIDDSKCNEDCPGNKTQKCGNKDNKLSLYKLGIIN